MDWEITIADGKLTVEYDTKGVFKPTACPSCGAPYLDNCDHCGRVNAAR